MGDGSTLGDPSLVKLLRTAGDEEKIPYQLRQPGGGGTDAGAIHLSRAGIPAISVSVPGRYLHTPASIIRLKDWQNSVALLYAALSRITPKTLEKAALGQMLRQNGECNEKLSQKTGRNHRPLWLRSQHRAVIEEDLKGHVDEIRVDGLGNLIVRKGPDKEGAPTIMLAAHMDEIGLMVTHVDENGFARFTKIGGVYPRYTAGARVRFLNGAAGVIGMEPHSNSQQRPGNGEDVH